MIIFWGETLYLFSASELVALVVKFLRPYAIYILGNNGFDEDESPISSFRKRSRTKYADDPNFNVDDPDNPTYLPPPELMPKPEPKSSKYCKMCCRSFFWILYVILQLVLMIIFFMTAYHPYCVLVDIVKFREDSSLYTVEINNQRPQALFLHCYGSGSETMFLRVTFVQQLWCTLMDFLNTWRINMASG